MLWFVQLQRNEETVNSKRPGIGNILKDTFSGVRMWSEKSEIYEGKSGQAAAMQRGVARKQKKAEKTQTRCLKIIGSS